MNKTIGQGFHRKQTGGVLLACCLLAEILTGCSDHEKVDYDLETQKGTQAEGGGMSQFADASRWTDEMDYTDSDGRQFKLSVNADIKLPDVDSMSVVEVEKSVSDADFKKQLLEGFCDAGEIYYHDSAYYTREELDAAILATQEMIEDMEQYLESVTGYENLPGYDVSIPNSQEQLDTLKQQLQEYQDAYENAGDTYTPAEEYDSCNQFIGYRDGVAYDISFPEDGNSSGSGITISPWSMEEVVGSPESLKDYDYLSWLPGGSADAGDNQCSLSMEDARRLADELAQLCGGSSQIFCEAAGMEWFGWSENDEGEVTVESDQNVLSGYCFTYGLGVDGLAFQSFGTYEDYVDMQRTGMREETFYDLKDSMEIRVMDGGVVNITVQYPLTVRRITEQVELLPLSSIQDIMKNEIRENFDQYHYDGWSRGVTKSFNLLELIYFRVKNPDDPDVYSYVPAWRLSQEASGYHHPILVNAVDGSVIYLEEELAGGGLATLAVWGEDKRQRG